MIHANGHRPRFRPRLTATPVLATTRGLPLASRLGTRGLARVDAVYRDFKDFYATRVDGENTVSGPITVGPVFYPEYIDVAWNEPEGDLATDQRHKARMWATWTRDLDRLGAVTVGVIQGFNSGLPYGAVGTINSGPYVTNAPSYRQAPATVNYYFTERDALLTDAWASTDVAATYSYKVGVGGGRSADLFVKAQVENLFNHDGLVVPRFINTGVLTNNNRPAALQAFNPFTETPVEGANWALDPAFGRATSRFGYQLPRTFRLAFGVRF